jgi:diguanylate cyclase (GGDEF)-like protein
MELTSSAKPPRGLLSTFFFGRIEFGTSEEYLQFRYKFLITVMISGAVLTAIFILGTMSQINPIGWQHGRSMIAFTTLSFVLWTLLRNKPWRFKKIAWTYEILCLCEYTSSLVFVPVDELRIMWFFTNIPGVFILLGQRAGWVITLLTLAGIVVGNPYLENPYSPNAMATASMAIIYMGFAFHAYVDRSISYFKRMRDYNVQLQDMASHDPLTGVMNARAYYMSCDQLIRSAMRAQQSFAVLFVDLDHFKNINDTYGHAAGDEVLRVVARTLSNNVRRSDVLGRIGGEEFSVFLPDTDLHGAHRLAEHVRVAIEACQPEVDGVRLKITASIGVAVRTSAQQSMQAIQQHADEAMYQAKRAGRNRVSIFDDRSDRPGPESLPA